MREAERIQAYARETARGFYEHVAVPPFSCFFHPRDPLRYFNYAIPDEPATGDLSEPLERLRAEFRKRDRLPRFEYIEGFAPGLAAVLDRAGFELELRAPLMTCRAADVLSPPTPSGFRIVPGSEDWRAYLTVGRRAFGSGDEPEATDEQVEERRSRPATAVGLLGLLAARPWRSAPPPRLATAFPRSEASPSSHPRGGADSAAR